MGVVLTHANKGSPEAQARLLGDGEDTCWLQRTGAQVVVGGARRHLSHPSLHLSPQPRPSAQGYCTDRPGTWVKSRLSWLRSPMSALPCPLPLPPSFAPFSHPGGPTQAQVVSLLRVVGLFAGNLRIS